MKTKLDSNRLFVALAKDPFYWFKTGSKRWELRKYGRQYTEKNVYPGRRVELRCGYSNPELSIWGTILRVEKADSIEELFKEVGFNLVIPTADGFNEAITTAKNILSVNDKDEVSFLAFEVRLD